MAQLARKKVNWKTLMLSALKQAKLKLSEYYSMTDNIHHDLYAIGTILAPQNKLHFFYTKEWEPCWRVRYRKSLEHYLVPYEQRYSATQSTSNGYTSADQISDIDMLITSATSFQPQTNACNKLTRYLGSTQEIQAAREEQGAREAVDEFDPISDNEEDTPAAVPPPIQRPSERALGKRPRTEATEDQWPLIELDNEDYPDEISLPDNGDLRGESSIQRRTSRFDSKNPGVGSRLQILEPEPEAWRFRVESNLTSRGVYAPA
ncbi:hypothetical protein ETB97_006743 [Aspergillus alliaceus]|uniref:Uncharacterized protein n=1 Tax=Petromyces alliaceus TaxID=209559 RepID=A0A8H6E2B5_PETAA|nr:hypothetical protein ETB97_006743 [Aspergillus burnettii]